jgi:hypothetical protein
VSETGRHVALVIPGLCGPKPDHPVSDYLQARPVALDRLLSRSRAQAAPGDDLETLLCRLFGAGIGGGTAAPVAPLTWLADAGAAGSGYLLRADPVHLRADQSRLLLFESHSFDLSQAEADQLVAAFNALYAERGWQLAAIRPQRWYLSLPHAPLIATSSPDRVAGQDIDACLPQGEAAVEWHALLNEVQMLFHDHPVNAAREQRDEPTINSLWFWGGGVLPERLQCACTQIITDHALGMGLAAAAGVPRRDLPADADELLALAVPGVNLVASDALYWPARYGDAEHWLQGLQQLEQGWFVPLLAALRHGKLASLQIYPGNGHSYITSRVQQHHFWKRIRPFEDVCRDD